MKRILLALTTLVAAGAAAAADGGTFTFKTYFSLNDNLKVISSDGADITSPNWYLALVDLSGNLYLGTPGSTLGFLVPVVASFHETSGFVRYGGDWSVSGIDQGATVPVKLAAFFSPTGDYASATRKTYSEAYTVEFGGNNLSPPTIPGRIMFGGAQLLDVYTPPTAAALSYFRAETSKRGEVSLSWETLVEVQTLGFHLERRAPKGEWQGVTTTVIPALGFDRQPHRYAFTDAGAPAARPLTYRLLEVNVRGQRTVVAAAVALPAVAERLDLRGGDLTVRFSGDPGRLLVVETASAVNGPWSRLAEIELDGEGTASLTVAVSGGDPVRFYRWEQE